MHVAISARALSLPQGGVKEAGRAMIAALTTLPSPHRFSVYYDTPAHLGSYPSAQEIALAAPHKFLWDHWALPRRLHRDRPDVVWFPHNVISLGLHIPAVVTINDLLYYRVPEFSGREYPLPDTLYMRWFIRRSVRRAAAVTTISRWTAFDLQRLLHTPADRITPVPLAAPPHCKPLPQAEVDEVRQRYDLHAPFFLYAGGLSRRKNLPRLVAAFGRIQHELSHDLVLVGAPPGQSPQGARIRSLGCLPSQDLVALYNAAEALVYPSLYEGFGMPPVEAFACGCPVICSNAASLPEVVGDAALTFDPLDESALAAHMLAVACDAALRARLRAAGLRRVQEWSYPQAAQRLLSVLEKAAGSGPAAPTLR